MHAHAPKVTCLRELSMSERGKEERSFVALDR